MLFLPYVTKRWSEFADISIIQLLPKNIIYTMFNLIRDYANAYSSLDIFLLFDDRTVNVVKLKIAYFTLLTPENKNNSVSSLKKKIIFFYEIELLTLFVSEYTRRQPWVRTQSYVRILFTIMPQFLYIFISIKH